jgi:K+-sensing histidine kinase KdpD
MVPHSNDSKHNYLLLTEVIDTGMGIEKEKQKMLFKPFGELREKDKIQDVENYTIGMGLTLSKDICK